MLRDFYQNGHLDYDVGGLVKGHPRVGSWTLSRVEVTKLELKPQILELQGVRIGDMQDPKQSKLIPVRTDEHVRIRIDRDPLHDSALEEALSRVFFRDSESFADVLPSYWRAFADGKVELVKESNGSSSYRIKGNDLSPTQGPFKVGPGITPPRAIYAPDPQYTDIAKASLYEGTTILQAEVTEQGRVDNIQILRPLGLGLDDAAVDAVRKWKFTPAKKNGEPVRVRINVEVNFRLT